MIVAKPDRRRLKISGVVDDVCGVSKDELSFRPNRVGADPLKAAGGTLNGRPILLSEVQTQADGKIITARFRHVD